MVAIRDIYDDPQSFVLLPTVQLSKIADVVNGNLFCKMAYQTPEKIRG